MIKPPNPGSEEATKLGCTCPVMDNHNGRGFMLSVFSLHGEGPMFWIQGDCPLHGTDSNKMKGD